MSAALLRRRKLGRTSCREICNYINQLGGSAKVVRSWKPREMDQPISREDDWLVRWGCTVEVGMPAEHTLNTSEAIHWCNNKRLGRLAMQEAGVPVPLTMDVDDFYRWNGPANKQWVARPARHAQGRNLVCGNYNRILPFLSTTLYRTGYVSELINKVAEYRVFVVQSRVAWVAQKTPGNPHNVAWNVAQGGRFDNVRWSDWNTKVLDAALKAAKVSGTDFCGVDVMVDAEGNPYVLEVNSAPSQTSPYRQQCVAKAFHYIFSTGSKSPFEDVNWNPRRTWKSYIHPAVRGNQ